MGGRKGKEWEDEWKNELVRKGWEEECMNERMNIINE